MKLTITTSQGTETLHLPANWGELTLAQYCWLHDTPTEHKIGDLCHALGLPRGVVEANYEVLSAALYWLESPEPYALPAYEPSTPPKLITIQVANAMDFFNTRPTPAGLLAFCFATFEQLSRDGEYSTDKVRKMAAETQGAKVREVLARCVYYRNLLESFINRYAIPEQDRLETTPEEEAAGATEMAEKHGFGLTLDQLAQGDIRRYDEILKMDANTVFYGIQIAAAKAAYQDRLRKIQEARH